MREPARLDLRMIDRRSEDDVTAALQAWRHGEDDATSELISMVYEELRRLAARALRRERTDHTLSSTALVHEAYLRLDEQRGVDWCNRDQFFAIAARMMRRILVDHARSKMRVKRGGDRARVPLEDVTVMATHHPPELLAVDEALTELAAFDPFKEAIVELRFFAGLTVRETAQVLGVSEPTVVRHWRTVRAWLYRKLYPSEAGAELAASGAASDPGPAAAPRRERTSSRNASASRTSG